MSIRDAERGEASLVYLDSPLSRNLGILDRRLEPPPVLKCRSFHF